jgi:hypothetical protein
VSEWGGHEEFQAEGAEAFARIAAACPSFVLDPAEADLPWFAAGLLGLHLADLLDSGRVEEVRHALAVVEDIVASSAPGSGAINMITTGLMEAVAPSRDDFAGLLGLQSRRWWRGLNAYLSQQQPRLEPRDT